MQASLDNTWSTAIKVLGAWPGHRDGTADLARSRTVSAPHRSRAERCPCVGRFRPRNV